MTNHEFLQHHGGSKVSHWRISMDQYRELGSFMRAVYDPAVIIDGYEMVPGNDENALMKAAANQPVSIAMDL
uniref:Uncharacterized protein n=1 Tax=Salix viminalis TaxID=40686 RepID=A0A6N2NBI5_SALVM